MKKRLSLLLTAVFATLAPVSTVVPVAAADAMASLDCTQAESMLENAVKNRVPALMTGDVDKDFATIMRVHERVGQRIYQIEAKCGKNAKMKSMAAKQADDAQERMDEFRSFGTSQ